MAFGLVLTMKGTRTEESQAQRASAWLLCDVRGQKTEGKASSHGNFMQLFVGILM